MAKKELYFFSINISFFSGREININAINGITKVANIKNKINELIKVPFSQQQLFYKNILLEDSHLLQYYQIIEDSTLKLFIKNAIIFIKKPSGCITSYEVRLSDTVKDLKIQIEEDENIPYINQCLSFESRELINSETLFEYGINNGDVISFFYRSKGGIKIFIKNEYNIIELNVELSDRIENVKEIILEKKQYFKLFKNLFYKGFILKDKGTIDLYDIQENSILTAI